MEWPNQTSRHQANDDERPLQCSSSSCLFIFLRFGIKHDIRTRTHLIHAMENHVANACLIGQRRTSQDCHQTTVLCQQSCHFYFVVFVYFLPDTKAQNSLRSGQNIVSICLFVCLTPTSSSSQSQHTLGSNGECGRWKICEKVHFRFKPFAFGL